MTRATKRKLSQRKKVARLKEHDEALAVEVLRLQDRVAWLELPWWKRGWRRLTTRRRG